MRPSSARAMVPSETPPGLNISVTSGRFAARDALEQLNSGLGPLGLSPDDASVVELILAEVVNNIVEHAYDDGARDGPIFLKCNPDKTGLSFEVTDHGHPMPDEQLPVGKPANLDVDFMDLPEGGFGWFLIKDLAEDVKYQRLNDANQLTFHVALAGQASTS